MRVVVASALVWGVALWGPVVNADPGFSIGAGFNTTTCYFAAADCVIFPPVFGPAPWSASATCSQGCGVQYSFFNHVADTGVLAAESEVITGCGWGCAWFAGGPGFHADDLVLSGPPGETHVVCSFQVDLLCPVAYPAHDPQWGGGGCVRLSAQSYWTLDSGYLGEGSYRLTSASADLPLNTPLPFALILVAHATASDVAGQARAVATTRLPVGEPVFLLPPGYTANCPSLGIVDNAWQGSVLYPVVLQAPDSAQAGAGGSAAFVVQASGQNLQYQWRRDGVGLSDGPTPHGSIIAGATTSALNIEAVQAADAGEYHCVVTNANGSETSAPATLSVLPTGDANCDATTDFGDINPFVLYLSNLAAWQAAYPGCPAEVGDINGDGLYPDFGDINPFVTLLAGG